MGTFRDQIYGVGDDQLDPGQVDSLDLLVQQDAWRMTDLADALRVDPSTATRAVQRLVKSGLAARMPDPEDGRVVMVLATPLGRERQDHLNRSRRFAMSAMLAEFDRDERVALADLMERFVRALDHFTSGDGRCVGH
jgi:DNA-binding MarR family transcriptional regulator